MNQLRPSKILVVDSDPHVLRALTELLSRAGHQVLATHDATEGLKAAQDPSVDVAIVDLAPNPGGPDLLAAMKQSRPEVEVVVLTDKTAVDAAVQALKAGAYDYLTKPLENLDEVSLTVAKAAERKELRQQLQANPPSLAHLPYAQAKRLALCAFERRYLSSLLEKSGFNISSAARAAGVDRSNFRRLLKQYEVGKGQAVVDEEPPTPVLGATGS